MPTAFQGAGTSDSQATNKAFEAADSRLPTPRISVTDVNKYPGSDVMIVAKPKNKAGANTFEFECVCSGEQFKVSNIPSDDIVSMTMELSLRVNPYGQGTFGYISSGMLNDDFDTEAYKELVKMIQMYPSIFIGGAAN